MTYREVSQVRPRVAVMPVAVDNRRLEDRGILQVDAGRGVPQEAGVARSLGTEDHGKCIQRGFI